VRSNAPVLRVLNLGVRRGKTQILRGVTWNVQAGEHWVILGANGSGKTSLLSALTGYLMPTEGLVEVFSKRFGRADWRELRRRIGLVSSSIRQMMADAEPALETVVSGKYAMIDFWGRMTPADRRRGLQILRQIECVHLADRPWLVLSQGERQRVLIGRSLMAKPSLLILDEPCAGLDPAAREHFLQFIQRLATGPRAPTLVLITHHVEEIVPAFSHLLVLRNGRVIACGEREKLLDSRLLTQAFNVPMRLWKSRGRYRLSVGQKPGVVV
jgi:iron complex transport system ATP-binding protein